jgi:hypothetical protein
VKTPPTPEELRDAIEKLTLSVGYLIDATRALGRVTNEAGMAVEEFTKAAEAHLPLVTR